MPELTTQTTDTSKYKPKNIPIDLILYYIETKGLNQTEAAKMLGCDSSVISRRLKKIDYQPGLIKSFAEGRVDLLRFHQREILKQYTPTRLKKASMGELNNAFGTLFDKERLLLGQSTENIAYADMVKINEIKTKKLRAFELKHGIQPEESAINGDYTETGNGQDETP